MTFCLILHFYRFDFSDISLQDWQSPDIRLEASDCCPYFFSLARITYDKSYTCMIYFIHVYDLLLAEKSHVTVRSFSKIAPKSNVHGNHLDFDKQEVLNGKPPVA